MVQRESPDAAKALQSIQLTLSSRSAVPQSLPCSRFAARALLAGAHPKTRRSAVAAHIARWSSKHQAPTRQTIALRLRLTLARPAIPTLRFSLRTAATAHLAVSN